MAKQYCKPWNAGLASETKSVCRRIGRLIDSLGVEINSNICEGEIVDDVWKFRTDVLTKLRDAGWSVEFVGDKTRVKAPRGE